MRAPARERFDSKWKLQGSGCWQWQDAPVQNTGYGRLQINRHSVFAHRFAWEAFNGEIPNGLFVCHTCDNRLCVNPDHLFLGTAADNNADKKSKGRSARLCGERNPRAKLTAAMVVAIRNESGLQQKEIAAKYGICQPHVSDIVRGNKWSHESR